MSFDNPMCEPEFYARLLMKSREENDRLRKELRAEQDAHFQTKAALLFLKMGWTVESRTPQQLEALRFLGVNV